MNKNQKVFMWYKVNELWKQGLNKSQISRELEIDRGTVRKYLAMDEQTFMLWINKPHRLSKKLSGYYKVNMRSATYCKVKKMLQSGCRLERWNSLSFTGIFWN